jgi:adenylylsulfate kinase-like enzyme
VSPKERRDRLGQSGAVVWISEARPGGALELAYAVERRLFDVGCVATVVDGDKSKEAAFAIARALAGAGVVAIVTAASPSAADREALARELGEQSLIEARIVPDGGVESIAPGRPIPVSIAGDVERASETVVAVLETRKIFG